MTTDKTSFDTPEDVQTRLAENICVHIFSVSAGMVGVCLTVIGLIRVVITIRKVDTVADDLLAFNAVLFLVACLLSYSVLRARNRASKVRLELIADGIFMLAMTVMVFACLFITYSIATF